MAANTEIRMCSSCRETLPIEQFAFQDKRNNKRQPKCRACHAAYRREHYQQNRQKYVDMAKTWAEENPDVIEANKAIKRRYVFEYLISNPCVDCGETNPIILEFDHVRARKKANISQLVCNGAKLTSIMAEIAKCEVRCVNCHRRVTYQRLKGLG